MLASLTVAALSTALLLMYLQLRQARAQGGAAAARQRAMAALALHADDVLLLIDASDRIAEANDRAVATYGWAREALVGRPVRELRAAPAQASFEEDWRSVREGGAHAFETEHRRRDGSTFPVEVSLGRA